MNEGSPISEATISVDAPDDLEALLEQSVQENWGDGLPLVPPTKDRVQRALDAVGLDPDLVIGTVHPSGAEATVRNVTINAIMAGCRAADLPLVFAATEAMCDPTFNLFGAQVTTHPVGVSAFVSGPLGAKFAVNAGGNAFGPGNRANAAIGRSIRLVMLNIGKGIPGQVDQATFGSPGKYTWFFGENRDGNPWASWAERSGAPSGASTVTAFGAGGFLNMMETTASADELLKAFAQSIASPTTNDLLLAGEPLVVLCPEHAKVLADAKLDVSDVQERLWEMARLPVSKFSKSAQRYRLGPAWTTHLGELRGDTMIPPCPTPDLVRIVVSGGPGRHSVYVAGTGITPSCDAVLDPYVVS